MSETLKHANAIVEVSVNQKFSDAVDRMADHNERLMYGMSDDNPHAIAEEMNNLMPWVDTEVDVEFVVEEGMVFGIMDDEELDPYDDGISPFGTIG